MADSNFLEKDILKNSYYVIDYFQAKGQSVTNLRLQKLMYFLEGLYIAITNQDSLYDEEFLAWSFGPVCRKLYNHYKAFGSEPIILTKKELEFVKEIPDRNKLCVQILFDLFGSWSSYELVEFTHEPGSPWSSVYVDDENERDIVVPKSETKRWLRDRLEIGDINGN